ncbi:MAG: tRNA (adenosine(37)-N6)-threonylcarbamoyltransferase complex dimerization subunit type 1 TsaB [Alphaproteobacteria bacterium]|jgi:tRNA threonylcarbamoyladenosine biosynthesis protein TsaB|nr:tRNA (adenosine(37)-N6)-threonylcarbamoyltransferase complex dimerization subunit type 1 TsaB [Alphaproteobacteria bacterium]MDP6565170.1 tRNA (adenosine(37)-N6)-threonylcarbamoyltransferase complex dimerization subunit type 1 TsaB [Alphaproteobacteria bacterium]MDP6812309.1 tRNA (adenosine(37)-N6)-threonylcarbamoyltransferase complex dimerization subunit type 1 TsaB [Alphaproteobacteria bacterium]
MPILALDTTMQACSVAIARDGEILARCHRPLERGHAEELLPMVEAVRRQAAIEFAELDLIAVTIGPGTFTGVRIGLAAARGLALVGAVPVLGLGTLEVLALAAPVGEPVIAAIDARRGEVYAQAFDGAGEAVTEALARPPSDLPPPPSPAGNLVGTGGALVRPVMPDWRLLDAVQQPDAGVLARHADRLRHRASAHGGPAPLYLRPTDARLPDGRGN